jgi:putative transposase
MPREKRINLPDLIYHVVNRGNNRGVIFAEESDYLNYLAIFLRYKIKFEFKVFGYCLMSNHIHLLIKASPKETISEIMKAITIAHARQHHKKYHTTGHLFEGRFKSPIVSDDEYLLTVMRYIEQNPVRAGIVSHPGDYAYSSFIGNTSAKKDSLLDKEDNPVYAGFGKTADERVERYREFAVKILEDEKVGLVRKSIDGSGHFVSKKFQQQIEEKLVLKEKKPRGRPRKVR